LGLSISSNGKQCRQKASARSWGEAEPVALVRQLYPTGKVKPCSITASELFKSSYVLTAKMRPDPTRNLCEANGSLKRSRLLHLAQMMKFAYLPASTSATWTLGS
jgi:hypothetical protein